MFFALLGFFGIRLFLDNALRNLIYLYQFDTNRDGGIVLEKVFSVLLFLGAAGVPFLSQKVFGARKSGWIYPFTLDRRKGCQEKRDRIHGGPGPPKWYVCVCVEVHAVYDI